MGKPCFGSLDDFFTEDQKRTNPRETRLLSLQRCVKYLTHACRCGNAHCRLPSCQKMKRVVHHAKSCKQKYNGGCPICKQLIALCCYHAKHCQVAECSAPFCVNIRKKILEGDTANMQSPRNSNSSSQPSPDAQPHTSSSGPPVGALQALQQVQASAARQAMPRMFASYYGNENPVVNPANTGLMASNQQMQAQMQNPMSQMMSGWGNSGYPQNQQSHQHSQLNYMPNSIGDSAMEPSYVMSNPGPSIPVLTQAWQQLLQTLKSPASAQQQQQVLAILKANPQLMAAFIKQRTAQKQQQQLQQQQQQQQLQQQQQQQQLQHQQQQQQLQHQQQHQEQLQQQQQHQEQLQQQQQHQEQLQQQQQQEQLQQQQQQEQLQQQQQQEQLQQQHQHQFQQLYSSPYPPQPDNGVRFSFGPPPGARQTVQQEQAAAARQTVPMVDTEYGNSPSSAQQQYQILAIMKDNPQLMADIIKQHSNFSSIENVD